MPHVQSDRAWPVVPMLATDLTRLWVSARATRPWLSRRQGRPPSPPGSQLQAKTLLH